MSASWLVFSDLASAQTRELQFRAALGYPDATGVYIYYCTPDQHPTSDQAALAITDVCDCTQDPYAARDAKTLLTPEERSQLNTYEEMAEAGWWPEEPAP